MTNEDLSVADVATDEVAEQAIEPQDFDLAAWLGGITPVRAAYVLDGVTIEMQAKQADWVRQWKESAGDDDQFNDRDFLAAHICDERVTAETLKALQEARPVDFSDMLGLAIQLDTRASNQINPRFLRGASA